MKVQFEILSEDLEYLLREIVRDEMQKAIQELYKSSQPDFSDLPEMMTRKEACKMIGISLGTLDSWAKQGIINRYRMGSIVRFRKDELIANFKTLRLNRYQRR